MLLGEPSAPVAHMKLLLLALHLLACTLSAAEPPIDWNRAGQLHQRAQRGEKLTPEEQSYYERAKAARAKGGQPPTSAPAKWAGHITPLTEQGAGKYKGEDGGLYGGGRNEPPPAHLEAALREAAKIQPLDAEGRPAKAIATIGAGKLAARADSLTQSPIRPLGPDGVAARKGAAG